MTSDTNHRPEGDLPRSIGASARRALVVAGDQMRARFAVFLEFQDGNIVRQRNYDCFEPW